MASRNAFIDEIKGSRPTEAKLEKRREEAIYNATVIAAAHNHKWYSKGNEEYEAMHDAEAIDVMMILFFKLKVQVNFVGMAKIAKGMKDNNKDEFAIEKGKTTWKVKVNCAEQRKTINKAAVTCNRYGIPEFKKEGEWEEVEKQCPWGKEEEMQVKKWCEES